MSVLGVGIVCMVVGGLLWMKLRNTNDFATREAKRYFYDFNKIDKNWSPEGKVYTKGIALIKDKKTGEKKFIEQAEISDVGLLS